MRFGEVMDFSIFSDEVMGFEDGKIPLHAALRHSAHFEVAIFHGLHADPTALPHTRFKPGFDKRDAFRPSGAKWRRKQVRADTTSTSSSK
jgi:hypothetical protein